MLLPIVMPIHVGQLVKQKLIENEQIEENIENCDAGENNGTVSTQENTGSSAESEN